MKEGQQGLELVPHHAPELLGVQRRVQPEQPLDVALARLREERKKQQSAGGAAASARTGGQHEDRRPAQGPRTGGQRAGMSPLQHTRGPTHVVDFGKERALRLLLQRRLLHRRLR